MIRIFFAIISLCAVSHLQSQGIGSLAGAPPDSVIDQVLNKIDPDQELKLEHFNILFGHINTPIIKEQKKITVYCGMEIQDIRDINPSKGTYHVRGFIWYYWDDPRYRFNGDKIESLKWNYKTLSERMWLPQLDFDNSVNKLERWSETIEIFPDGMIEYWCYFSGEFSDQNGLMDFRLFPCEKLPVSIDVNTQYHSGLLEMKYCRLSTNEDIVLEIKKDVIQNLSFRMPLLYHLKEHILASGIENSHHLGLLLRPGVTKGIIFFTYFCLLLQS